jgi:glycosyltransferase involved in cell wall biosynthesis
VHDWFQGFHGSERVVEAMRTGVFDEAADVFTFHAERDMLPASLARAIVRESRVARLPGVRDAGRWRYLLPYMPIYFAHLDLSEYDVVVSSSHACALHVRPPAAAAHVCYCYTPIRYVWLPETDERRLSSAASLTLRATAPWFRRRDRRAARRPDSFVAISTAVAERIRRFYGREATVIHPPVDVSDFRHDAPKDRDRFLWVGRLVPYKRPGLVLEAFRSLPYRLTIVGEGPLEAELRASLPENVELLGWQSREQLADLFAGAGGFIHVGEEDFGISMVEALAAGTPVIANSRGGARDIVRDGVDGRLVEDVSVASVRRAVEEIRAGEWDADALRERAESFSRPKFVRRFGAHVADVVAQHSS